MRGTHFAEISAFVAVAEDGSFTKAAKRLGVSVATLSQNVRALEERLGVRLLNRTTRNVAPTDAGTHMLNELQPLLSGLDGVMDSINSFRDKPSGHLRLTVPPPVGHFLLAPLLARFSARYPEITMEIVVQSSLHDIVADRFDAGVHSKRFLAQDMVAVRMTANLRRVVVASPDYLAKRGRPSSPSALKEPNCIRIRLPDGSLIRWMFAIEGSESEIDVAGSVVLNSPELEIRSAAEGLGIAYTFHQFVAPLIAEGRLVSLFEESVLPEDDGFYLFYPSRKRNPAALRVLINFLQTTPL